MNQDEIQVAASLAAVSVAMRGALCNLQLSAARLASAAQREASPEIDAAAAELDLNYYQLLRVINNLADAAYLTGEKKLRPRLYDAVKLVNDFCVEISDLADETGLDFRYTLPAESLLCSLDPSAIRLVLYHLTSNAMKFTPKGGSVRVSLEVMDRQLLLSVSDTGRGIREELIPTLFSRYLHADRFCLPRQGLGLGLPLCRKIAEAHGGTLIWQSREGRGSRFTITLPAELPENSPVIVRDVPYEIEGGHNAALLGLADALDSSAFLLRKR